MGDRKKQVKVEELDDAQLRELVPTLLHTIDLLRSELADLRRGKFGRGSEKGRYLDGTGLLPFDELDQLRSEAKDAEAEAEAVEVPGHTRKRTKRRSDFPEHFPRKHSNWVVPEGLLPCPSCGTRRIKFGESTTNELERIEITYVHVIAREKCACPKCEGNIVLAAGPEPTNRPDDAPLDLGRCC